MFPTLRLPLAAFVDALVAVFERSILAGVIAGCLGAACMPGARVEAADDALARQGYAVLDKYCIRCHGVQSSTPGLNMFVRETMLTSDSPDKPPFLVPGKPRESRIYLHATGLRQDKMPPEDQPQPTQADLDLLARWIDAGATYPRASRPARDFVGDRQIVEAVLKDIEAQPAERRPFLRYFTIGHLWNDPDTSDTQLAVTRAAVSKLVNSLSSKRQIVPPAMVGGDGLILRIDMRDYGWTERTHWHEMLAQYPYGLRYDSDLYRRLSEASKSDLPYIRGDWFCHHATRPALYNRLMMVPGQVGLPDTEGRLEQLLGVDLAGDFDRDQIKRAGMSGQRSGVSDHNRIVERHDTVFGYYWISYDSAGSGDRRNHSTFPLGPKFANRANTNAFEHDGGEIIFSLPNGLQAYMLVTADGKRLEEGPPEIVQDKAFHSGSFKIVNAVSCMGCHRDGMISFMDTIRQVYEGRPGDVADKVRRIYPTQEEMQVALGRDRAQFTAAAMQAMGPFLKDAGGGPLNVAALPEPITDVSKRYHRDLDVAAVARELGLPADRRVAEKAGITVAAEEFPAAIRASDNLRRLELGPLAAGESISRSQWERNCQRVSRDLGLGLPMQVQ